MSAGRIILIVLVFVCLVVGAILAMFSKFFAPLGKKYKNANENFIYRRGLKIKLIGYVVLMLSLVFAISQSFLV